MNKNKNKLLYLLALISGISHQTYTFAAPAVFSGSGAAATTEFDNFKAAIKTTTTVDGNRIGWDAVKLDGTDANPNTKIIDTGKTVQIPVDRFKNFGAIFADPYTVSGDGFATVNPGTAGQFPAFSVNNIFAMFDAKDGQFEDRNIQQSFVLPNTNTKAGTRGFGAIFVDVEKDNSSSIEYFGKNAAGDKISLGKYYVKPGTTSGEPQFLGVLFDSPIISEVELILGAKALFSFDGASVKAFGPEDLAKGIDLAVTDDFFFAVPEALQTATLHTNADCLFNWAEKYYSTLFSPAATTQTYAPYIYRYYKKNNFYLGVSTNDDHVYYLDNHGIIHDAGALYGWLVTSNCQ